MLLKCSICNLVTYGRKNNSVLATGGMYADAVTLVKRVEQRLEGYQYQHDKTMSAPAAAQMLSTILYGKRFFPYYVWNTLGGLDENGNYRLKRRKWMCI